MDPAQGPILDALKIARDFIWFQGFWWGCLCGFVGGIVFSLLSRATDR